MSNPAKIYLQTVREPFFGVRGGDLNIDRGGFGVSVIEQYLLKGNRHQERKRRVRVEMQGPLKQMTLKQEREVICN